MPITLFPLRTTAFGQKKVSESRPFNPNLTLFEGVKADDFTRRPRFSGADKTAAANDKTFPGTALGVTLEPMTEAEIDEVSDFIFQVEQDEYGHAFSVEDIERSKAEMRKILDGMKNEDRVSMFWVLREQAKGQDGKGKLVGCSAIGLQNRYEAMLEMTYIAPAYRNKGIGGWLMDQRIARAKANGILQLSTYGTPVTVHNALQRGFVAIHDMGKYGVLMKLNLLGGKPMSRLNKQLIEVLKAEGWTIVTPEPDEQGYILAEKPPEEDAQAS
jgi:GNAT superfamily N-acetyltransferase